MTEARGDNVMEAVMQRRSRSIQLSLDEFRNWMGLRPSPLARSCPSLLGRDSRLLGSLRGYSPLRMTEAAAYSRCIVGTLAKSFFV